MASYRKLGNGWEYRISYKDVDGKYRLKSKRGFRTKKDAERAASEAEKELAENIELDKDITFLDYFNNWAATYKEPNVSSVTWKAYINTSRKIKLFFKQTKLANITASLYQKVINDYAKTHAQDTVERFNVHVKQAIAMALHEGYITKDFTAFVTINAKNKGIEPDSKFLEIEEYENVIQVSREKMQYKSYAVIYLIARTGMRFAEAIGVTWADVDFENQLLNVDKTWDYKNNTGFIPTKTKSSIRKIPLDDETLNTLKEYRDTHWEENPKNLLFPSVSNNAVNKTLRKIVQRNVHAHSLRHTYASFLISQNIELLSISKILGHKNMNITIEVYAHQLKNLEEKSNDEVRAIFNNFG